MKIALASDHAGFSLKQKLAGWLNEMKYEVIDFGCRSEESVDYPDYAFKAANAVIDQKLDFGIILCGTGIGVNITANKVKGIRAANCCSVQMAELARKHNNANVLNLGARLIDFDLAKEIISTFLNTEFEGNRHQTRIDKIHSLTHR